MRVAVGVELFMQYMSTVWQSLVFSANSPQLTGLSDSHTVTHSVSNFLHTNRRRDSGYRWTSNTPSSTVSISSSAITVSCKLGGVLAGGGKL